MSGKIAEINCQTLSAYNHCTKRYTQDLVNAHSRDYTILDKH